MFFEILFLGVALWTFHKLENPIYSVAIHVVPLALLGFIFDSSTADVAFGSLILACFSFGYFMLLSYLPYGKPYFTTMVVGFLLFVFVI